MNTGSQWFVRTADGKEYGPAVCATLVAWARDSRIEPTSLISSDRKSWMPAPLMRELCMEWLVETEFGRFFGPFHRNVIERLHARGMLPASSRTYRLTSELPAADRSGELSEALSQVQKDLAAVQAKANALSSELADERRKRTADAEALNQAKQQIAALTNALNRSQKDNATLQDNAGTLSTELKQIQSQDLTLNEELKQAQEQTRLARAKLDDFAKRLAAADTDKETLASQLADQMLQQRHLKDELVQKQAEEQAVRSELEDTRKALQRVQAELKAAQDGFRNTQAELKAAQDGLRNTQAELKAAQDGLRSTQAELKAAQDGLASAHGEIESERNRAKALEKKLDKANKAAPKSGGLFKGLFGGSSSEDLSVLEQAIRRELAAAKHQRIVRSDLHVSAPRNPDVIDV